MLRVFSVVMAALLTTGCVGREQRSEQVQRRPPVLAGVPLIPLSTIVDTSGTPEALLVTLAVGMPVDSVASFYHRVLPPLGWRIVSDVREPGGANLYAERAGPSLWIEARDIGNGSTRYRLIGAHSQPGRGDSLRPY